MKSRRQVNVLEGGDGNSVLEMPDDCRRLLLWSESPTFSPGHVRTPALCCPGQPSIFVFKFQVQLVVNLFSCGEAALKCALKISRREMRPFLNLISRRLHIASTAEPVGLFSQLSVQAGLLCLQNPRDPGREAPAVAVFHPDIHRRAQILRILLSGY